MAFSALATAGALGVLTLPAEASTAYRYWSYWNADPSSTKWGYATEGSGTHVPRDGSVEGWRFGVAGDGALIQPSALPNFETLCAGVSTPADGKRVAIVIDPGTEQEAPEGDRPGTVITECVTVQPGATGLQILQSLVDVRMEAGFVCGLDGYPSRECAPLVELPQSAEVPMMEPPATSNIEEATARSGQQQDVTSDTGTPLISAVAISILALVGFGIWRRRKRERV